MRDNVDSTKGPMLDTPLVNENIIEIKRPIGS